MKNEHVDETRIDAVYPTRPKPDEDEEFPREWVEEFYDHSEPSTDELEHH